ncbi:MAG: exodeoxyribonuclease VII small subunit [Candidatus Eisenbacteria bacterium]|uniref:Exodeoxyribonuclease 7 small subunit n=1 Tax=Eiseniibacteriota bacterium TaxID=2212470 RepID=A0A948RST9_UNCEI|nr:exodeoxyribonuclease VII small subunit [Candidatus Eisenbacteria bacterium]MBU1949615.1 exodeoxyribonuclease VII small subunit [Candidatus Eisenbacteria bacterium]MBU2690363.1 exodeoxyribonuclease VII small subunit [Candidatus Eisenbacteria bacterium]
MVKKKSEASGDLKLDKLSFEESLSRLEQIVKELEEGEQGLEDSIRLYEEGRQLVRHSMARLGEAQSRIEELVKTDEGWETASAPLEDN